jgi:hypothetical protein
MEKYNDIGWEAEIAQRTAEDTNVATGEKYKATEKDVEEFINDMNSSQKQHAFDPNDWYDWSVAVSKMPYSQMRQDKRFRALAIRTFHFRDKKVDVSGIDYNPKDADELFDESHIVRDRFTVPFKGDKKQQLKARLQKVKMAAIGIDLEKKEKTIGDMQKEQQIKQRKYLNTPQKKPKQSDFNKIISAARAHIKEAKIDSQHNHSIEWRQVPKGEQRTAFKIETYDNRRFTKYWLLNAKQVNGNGWGVDPSTIDENIQKFVGKPFVVTAQSWIPDSEYGNSYVHPYIPTNNLKRIFQHQAKYTVGIVRRIIKDEKDDYYAMIEKLPRFAHMRDPPFCSPGIFQMDRNEPMDKIRTWEPLHLAGLEEDPAYGAHVALLKGNCVGTELECFIQFRGAKMEVVTQCPVRGAKKDKLKERLAALNMDGDLKHVRTKEVINDLAKGGELSEPESGSFIDPDGRLLPSYGTNHYDTVRELGHKVGMNFNDEKHNRAKEQNIPYVSDEDVHEFLQKTGLVRVQHFPREQSTSVHIATPLTSAQRTRIKHFTEDNPNGRLGFFVGPHYENASMGEGFNNLMREHSRQFAPKMAQGDDEDTNYNMTYMKSKPTKVKKKRFSQAHAKIQNVRLRQLFAEVVTPGQPPKVKINPSHGKVIASAYDKMEHRPNDPYVKTAYGAFINETKQQYRDLLGKGLKTSKQKDNGYKTAELMHQDIEKNNHLSYFPTGKELSKDHPLSQSTEFKDEEGKQMSANDVFRVVHDINGHHLGGRLDFSPEGEHQAFLTHRKMYSQLAQKALFTETAAQANHFAFGPNGEHNLKNPNKAIFSEEKAGILPTHIINGHWHEDDGKTAQLIAKEEIKIETENDEPLQLKYNGETLMENGAFNLGKLTESDREDEDWHEYSVLMINNSDKELRGIRLETNLSDEQFSYTMAESLGAKQQIPMTIRVRASKILNAELKETPYVNFKYREILHY